jgi:hypothetical protein
MFDVGSQLSGIRGMEVSMSRGAQNQLHDLTGTVLGLLTVEERGPNNEFDLVYWWCRCVCGERLLKRANTLRAGKFFTCGKAACRFFEKVDKNGPVMPGMTTPCWVWTGALHSGGYGVMKEPGEKRLLRAHVFSWEQKNGAVPSELFVLHRCDNRPCVRWDHLFLGTNQDNMRDMVAKGRSHALRRKVDSDSRKLLRARYAAGGISQDALATEFGITPMTVRRILREPDNT